MAKSKQQDNEAGSEKSVNVLLIALFTLGGLLLGGGAVYFLTAGDDQTAVIEEQVPAEPEKVEDPIDLLVVTVQRFAVPLIDADKAILGYMWVDLAFEVDGPDNQSYVAARLPELRDAFLRGLNDVQTTRGDRPGALDFTLLHKRLEAAAHKTMGQSMGKNRVHAVRITNAQRVPG